METEKDEKLGRRMDEGDKDKNKGESGVKSKVACESVRIRKKGLSEKWRKRREMEKRVHYKESQTDREREL